jgi:hypothetical protein
MLARIDLRFEFLILLSRARTEGTGCQIKPPTIGVFNKGKASAKMPVAKKFPAKQGMSCDLSYLIPVNHTMSFQESKIKLFSEFDFLNKTRKASSPPSSDSTSIASKSCASTPVPKKILETNRDMNRKSFEDPEKRITPDRVTKCKKIFKDPPSRTTVMTEERAKSEVWDIEVLDVGEYTDAVSPISGVNPHEEAMVQDADSFQSTEPGRFFNEAKSQVDDLPVVSGDMPLRQCSPSLGPSDSASEVGQRAFPPSVLRTSQGFSKYFVPPAVEDIRTLQDMQTDLFSRVQLSVPDVATIDGVIVPDVAVSKSPNEDHSQHQLHPSINEDLDIASQFSYIPSSAVSLERALQAYEADNAILKASELQMLTSKTGVADLLLDGDYHSRDFLDESWAPTALSPSFYGSAGKVADKGLYLRKTLPRCCGRTNENEAPCDHDDMTTIQEFYERCPRQSGLQVPQESFLSSNADFDSAHCFDRYDMHYETEPGEDQADDDEHCDLELNSNACRTHDSGCRTSKAFQTRPTSSSYIVEDEMSEIDDGSPVYPEWFLQGQAILRLYAEHHVPISKTLTSLSRAEADVAKTLKGHWYPQQL